MMYDIANRTKEQNASPQNTNKQNSCPLRPDILENSIAKIGYGADSTAQPPPPSYSNNFLFPGNLSLPPRKHHSRWAESHRPPAAPGCSSLSESRRPFEKWHWALSGVSILVSCGDADGAGELGPGCLKWATSVGILGVTSGHGQAWLSPSTPFPQAPEASPVLSGMGADTG